MKTYRTALAALALAGCRALTVATGASQELPAHGGEQADGVYHLLFNDFHGLTSETMNTNAMPWKLAGAALVAHRNAQGDHWPETEAGFKSLMSYRYGFVNAERIGNWPLAEPAPKLTKPVGVVSGYITKSTPSIRVEAVNQGCATCHAASTWDATGRPLPHDIWLGMPSASIDLERYAVEIYASFLHLGAHEAEVLALMGRMFPSIDEAERHTIESFIVPRVREKMVELEATTKRFQPFDAGGPGLTNGVGAMKVSNRFLGRDKFLADETAFTSIPDVGGLALRKSLLYDGVYAPPGSEQYGALEPGFDPARHADELGGVIALFSIGTLGIHPDDGPRNVPPVRKVVRYFIDRYTPAPFPGKIDGALADQGRAIYENSCASCHGSFSEGEHPRLASFPNFVTKAMGTDPTRSERTHGPWGEMLQKTPIGAYVGGGATNGYVAIPLTGLWASAPYLHNGSVPTLWHLMHPAERPAKFQVGGHALDFEKVGIAGEQKGDTWSYREGFEPWMLPDTYDTARAGHARTGHDKPFVTMSEPDKTALLEYLKRL